MKKTLLSLISFILILCTVCGAFVACFPSWEGSDDSSGSSNESSPSKSEDSEESSGEQGGEETSPSLDGISNGALIESANALANGVQAYFPADRSHFTGQIGRASCRARV